MMTKERIKELHKTIDDWTLDSGNIRNYLEECLAEIEELQGQIKILVGDVNAKSPPTPMRHY